MVCEALTPAMGQPPAQYARENAQEENASEKGVCVHATTWAMRCVHKEPATMSPGTCQRLGLME